MSTEIPLCIKLNSTLIATNIVLEALIQLLNQNPLLAFCVPFWRFKGKLYFEEKLFTHCELNIKRLPFRKKVVDFIEAHKDNGRTIVLIDTVYVDYVRLLGGSLKIFDSVLQAENSAVLLKKLKRNFSDGYDFIGSNAEDMPFFENARLCYLVEPNVSCLAQARKTANVETVFKTKRDKIKLFFQTIHIERIWWILPVFLPLLLNPATILKNLSNSISVFLLYLIIAFGLFILNDIYNMDSLRKQPRSITGITTFLRSSDKQKASKKQIVPVAFGLFRISAGLKLSAFFLIAGVLFALSQFSAPFNLLLFLFLGLSLCLILTYSRSKALRNILLALLIGMLAFSSYVSLIFDNNL